MTTAADDAIYAFRTNIVVTASAGTGKTFRLVTLYALLTLGLTSKGERDDASAAAPVSPARIAATTFSRAAAAEIRERVERVLRAVAAARYDRTTEAYRAVLDERARQTRSPAIESRVLRERAESALGELPHALIDTLHGMSGRIVRGSALEIGMTPAFGILDEDEARASGDAAIEEGLSAALGRGDRAAMDLLDAGGGLGMTRRRIGDLLDRADEEGVDVGDLVCTDMSLSARAAMERLRDLGQALMADGSKTLAEPAHDAVRAANAWLDGSLGPDDLVRALEPLFGKRSPQKPLPSEEAFLSFRQSIRGEKLAEKARQLAAFVTSAHELGPRTRAMAAILADIARRRASARRAVGVLGFGDLLTTARAMMRDRPDVASAARAAHEVLLVDEFQDTSRVQRDLVYLLRESSESRSRRAPGTLPAAADLDTSGLLIVGDRKQSIYGFRGADVTVFAQVAADLAGASASAALELSDSMTHENPNAALVSLSENRRSDPGILRFVNWFADADFAAGGLHAFDIRYAESEHLVPAEAPARDAAADGAHVLLIDDRDETPEDAPSLVRTASGAMREALIAAGVVAEQVRGDDRGAVSFRDVAILARRRATLPLLEFALARLDIPYVVAGRGLFETREVRDLAALLRLILDPYDRHALATMLRGPALGLTDASLALLSEPPRGLAPPSGWFFPNGGAAARLDEDERARLRRFHQSFSELREVCLGLGPADALRHAVQKLDLDRVVAALPHAPQHIGNIDRLVSLASQHGGSLPSFVRWLERQIADQSDESEAAVLSEADDAVTLLTIHASKGLEFPVVVLVDTGAAVRAQPLTMAIAPAQETGRARLVVRHTRDQGGTLYTPEAVTYQREATAREIAERRRLTYVAMTRAKERLIVLVPSAEPVGSAASTLRRLLPDVESCPGTVVRLAVSYLAQLKDLIPGRVAAAVSGESGAARRSLPVLPDDGGVLSLSTTPLATFAQCPRKYRLVHEMGLEVPVWEGARRSLGALSMEQRRAAGTAAHRVLERFPIHRWGTQVGRAEIDDWLTRETPPAEPIIGGAVAANVARFLGSRYAARVRENGSAHREEPFVLELGSDRQKLRLRGTIDLLVTFRDRSADVIDYKSSGGGDGGAHEDAHVDSMDSAREFQLRAYGLAAARKYDVAPVRIGIVNLSSPAEPSAPRSLDDAELAHFESRLLDLRTAFVAARARSDFPGLAREQCSAIHCGFIRACHG